MRGVGDRRSAVRLDVVGALWGTLEFHKPALVRDLNQDGALLELSHTEFQLLVRLMERPGRVLSREQLLELVKGSADEAFDRAVDVQVSRLRQKLGDVWGHRLIKTIRGVGYMLVASPKPA